MWWQASARTLEPQEVGQGANRRVRPQREGSSRDEAEEQTRRDVEKSIAVTESGTSPVRKREREWTGGMGLAGGRKEESPRRKRKED